MKKPAIVLLVFLVIPLIFLLGCNKNSSPKIIGIVQFVHHPLLDETQRGLLSELKQLGLDDGTKYSVKTQVADKNPQICSQIARQYQQQGAVIIIAIATPAAQAVASLNKDIPIVFAAITDPVAANLVDSIEKPGRNMTGTSNKWPFDKQISLIPLILPHVKKIAALWNPSEMNSEAAMSFIRPLLKRQGLEILEVPVATTADVATAAKVMTDRTDAFLMIPDNTTLSATATLAQIALEAKKPLIGGDLDTVRKGSLATYGYDYFELGKETAHMVKNILIDGQKPANMPVQYPKKTFLILNEVVSKKLGISFPEELIKTASYIVK